MAILDRWFGKKEKLVEKNYKLIEKKQCPYLESSGSMVNAGRPCLAETLTFSYVNLL